MNVAHAGGWSVDIHAGSSVKPLEGSLLIRQDGHPDARIDSVRYETRAFSNISSLFGLTENYYAVRVSYHPVEPVPHHWDVGYELELIHDKAYYVSGNDPDGVVQHFELSDGINYLQLNVAARYPVLLSGSGGGGRLDLIARFGTGPVVTAPTTIIRDREHGTRQHGNNIEYAVAGWGAQASAQVRYLLTSHVGLSLEAKASMANTTNRIAGGTATTSLPTLHVTFGLTGGWP